MTVLIRAATEAPQDEITPGSPTLAMLCEKIATRLQIFDGEPVILDDGTYEAAESEMKKIFTQRGYSQIARAQMPNKNFLLFGVPICRGD